MQMFLEFSLYVLASFISTQIFSLKEGTDVAHPWETVTFHSPRAVSFYDAETSPAASQYASGCGCYIPPPVETPFSAGNLPTTTEADPAILPTATEVAPATSAPGIANLLESVIFPEIEVADEEFQNSRQQWLVDSFFAVMNILLVIFMTFGTSTNLLGFLQRHHHQAFVTVARKNLALRLKTAALQAKLLLSALPPPTSDKDLDGPAQTASGSTQTEEATCSSVGIQTEPATYSSVGVQTEAAPCSSIGVQTEPATCSSIGVQTEPATTCSVGTQTDDTTDSATVWTQTDAVECRSVGTQTTPDAAPEDSALVAELRAELAKQRTDSENMIRSLQASLTRQGKDYQQLRLQMIHGARSPYTSALPNSPSPGGVPTVGGLAYDPHHNPNPAANAAQLAQNQAMQQQRMLQQAQQSPRWQPSPGQGHGRGRGRGQ